MLPRARTVLRYVLVTSATTLDPDAAGIVRTLRDYRGNTTDRRDAQRDLTGRGHARREVLAPHVIGMLDADH